VIHHVSLEVDEHDADAEVAFWELLGCSELTPPGALAARARWVERDGVQVHLVYAQTPAIPRAGHVAIVVADYDAVLARLRAQRHDAAPRAEHFGAPRTQVRSPAGHLVEVMAPVG
jgi:hypothetical protein